MRGGKIAAYGAAICATGYLKVVGATGLDLDISSTSEYTHDSDMMRISTNTENSIN